MRAPRRAIHVCLPTHIHDVTRVSELESLLVLGAWRKSVELCPKDRTEEALRAETALRPPPCPTSPHFFEPVGGDESTEAELVFDDEDEAFPPTSH